MIWLNQLLPLWHVQNTETTQSLRENHTSVLDLTKLLKFITGEKHY